MTVASTTTPLIQYSGNGVTTAFSTSFVFSSSADLVVVLTSAAGVDTTKTITTHYTVTGGNGSSGTVTMITPPASGETLTIYRQTALTQLTDYVENDAFPAETHEAALDKLTLITQELQEDIGRAVQLSATSGLSSVAFPSPGAGEFIKWNSGGTALETIDIADVSAIELPASNGLMVYSGTTSLTSRTLTGTANEITVTNGSGVSGNPTLSLPSALTFTGKTVTGGTFSSPSITNASFSGGGTLSGTFTGGTLSGPTITSGTLTSATIDGGTIGSTTAVTILNVDNLRLDGNTISSTNANGNIILDPNGTGGVQLAGDEPLLDSNGNELLKFVATGSAVNEVTITNGATSNNPTISATGGDTNIGLTLVPKGTGGINLTGVANILGTSTASGKVRLFEDTDNGSNYVELTTPESITSNRSITIPDSDISCFVVQRVSTLTGAVATGTTITPLDDTIPQITEGTEFMTRAITPKNSNNILVIDVTLNVASSVVTPTFIAALHQDSTANALAAMTAQCNNADGATNITFRHIMTAGTTSSTTFRVRVGLGGAATVTFNGVAAGTRRMGGVMASSITVTEYSA